MCRCFGGIAREKFSGGLKLSRGFFSVQGEEFSPCTGEILHG